MPKYRIQLKQGSRTIVNHLEAKSVAAVLDFFNSLTTTQVSEILKVEYSDDTLPPVDDMAFYPLCKFFVANDDTRKSMQVVLHNIKLNKNENDIVAKARECLDIDNLSVDNVRSILFKECRLNSI